MKLFSIAAPEDLGIPFTIAFIGNALRAVDERKMIPLKDLSPTSLLIPSDADNYVGISKTFTIGRLDKDTGFRVFREALPQLPRNLIDAEYDTRMNFSQSLHTMIGLEALANALFRQEALSAFAQSLGTTAPPSFAI